jgi:hypothetical protein
VVVWSASLGATVYSNAYTYHPAGSIPQARDNLQAWITLTNSWLNGTNGIIFIGGAVNDCSGYSVGSAGDVNKDGYPDFLIGAYGVDPQGRNSAGATYLVYGRSNSFPSTVTLTNSWLNGTNGISLVGGAANDYSGYSVSSAGDMNKDGYADLLIGAACASPQGRSYAGATYLVYSRSTGFPATVTLTNSWLNGTNGITLVGAAANAFSGCSVRSAGDVNGDGYPDLLIGAYQASPAGRSSAGETYLVYGRSTGFPATVTLTNSWFNGTNGSLFAGVTLGDWSGYSVNSAGDVNGDGYPDLLIGAYRASPAGQSQAGETYLVYGRSNGFPATVTLTNSWLNGTNGITFAGAASYDYSGTSVNSAGDVNRDGYADLLIGANGADPQGRYSAGATYLVFGRSTGFPATVTLTSSWLNGTNGITLAGASPSDGSGFSVSSAGDVNGDGHSDLLIGAYQASPAGRSQAGATYLVYGRSNGFPATVTLTNSWLDGTNGITLVGAVAGDSSGFSVSSAGDVNGDGFADLLIGADGASPVGRTSAGETYLVFGRRECRPVIPSSGSWLGGYQVVISGSNLGNGSDISNVTICGVAVQSIFSQCPTQIVVVAAAGNAGLGDVRVFSTSFGETIGSNAFTYIQTSEALLTIRSPYGNGTPAVGVYTNPVGATLTNAMASPDTHPSVQYVCSGWTMSGHDPFSGSGLSMTMTVTNNAVLSWRWTTNYWLNPVSGPNGTVDPSPGWFSNGEVVVVSAVADAYYHFTQWTGDVASTDNPLNLTMTGSRILTALFAANMTTNKSVPEWWLAKYGMTNHVEEAVDEDFDHDGVPTGSEWFMNTDPTNPLAYLHLSAIDLTGNGSALSWLCATDRVYDVEFSLSNPAQGWAPLAGLSNLTPQSELLVVTNTWDANDLKFYRLKVRLPE